jgi:hypothetical protein
VHTRGEGAFVVGQQDRARRIHARGILPHPTPDLGTWEGPRDVIDVSA